MVKRFSKIAGISFVTLGLSLAGQSAASDQSDSRLSTLEASDIPFLGRYTGRSGFFSESCTVVVEYVKPSSGYAYISIEATRGNTSITAQRRFVETLDDVTNGVTPMDFVFSTGGGDLLTGTTAKVSLSWTEDGINKLSVSISKVLFGVIAEQSSIDCNNLRRM